MDAIRRLLPAAQNLGIAREEIAAAKRILSWELKQTMCLGCIGTILHVMMLTLITSGIAQKQICLNP